MSFFQIFSFDLITLFASKNSINSLSSLRGPTSCSSFLSFFSSFDSFFFTLLASLSACLASGFFFKNAELSLEYLLQGLFSLSELFNGLHVSTFNFLIFNDCLEN